MWPYVNYLCASFIFFCSKLNRYGQYQIWLDIFKTSTWKSVFIWNVGKLVYIGIFAMLDVGNLNASV